MAKRVIVVGAGPIGVVAALGAARRGHDVTLLEAGQVGDALRRWGPVRLFTPLGMSLPPALLDGLPLSSGAPPPDALLTGPELAERVLVPLAARLGERLRTHHRVVAVGRARMSRGELVGHPLRAERPFRLLVETPAGERTLEAERVLDASGVYGQPLPLGAGGLPAPGERAVAARILRDLGVLHQRRDELAARRTLVVGHGHSAAHALALLEELAAAQPETRVVWAVRSANLRPCVEVASDPLPERQSVVTRANLLAQRPPPWLTVERRAQVERLDGAGPLDVQLTGERRVTVDAIVALTGYRPDLAPLAELALELGPRSEGSARLERAVGNLTDCLSLPSVRAADLESGEPGFHLVGHKSYGRARTFLLQAGYQQLETVLDLL